MSLTPLLGELATYVADALEEPEATAGGIASAAASSEDADAQAPAVPAIAEDAVVVCGYGEMGRAVCASLSTTDYVAFDLNPSRVSSGVLAGAPVVYGDGASTELLRAAGVQAPRAVAVTYQSPSRRLDATSRLRAAFPDSQLYVRARSQAEADELLQVGATAVIDETTEIAVGLGMLLGSGDDVEQIRGRVLQSHLDSLPPPLLAETAAKVGCSEAELQDYMLEMEMDLKEVPLPVRRIWRRPSEILGSSTQRCGRVQQRLLPMRASRAHRLITRCAPDTSGAAAL